MCPLRFGHQYNVTFGDGADVGLPYPVFKSDKSWLWKPHHLPHTLPALDYEEQCSTIPEGIPHSHTLKRNSRQIATFFVNEPCVRNSPPCYVAYGDLHSQLAGRQRAEQATANVSCSKKFLNSVYTNNVLNACVHVWRTWWYYEQSDMLCRVLVF